MKPRIKKAALYFLGIFIVSLIGFLGVGTLDYLDWQKAKQAVAGSGLPWQCGAYEVLAVQPGCTPTCSGKCCCAACDPLCNGSTYVTFAGQPSCGVNFACIGPDVIPKGGPILSSKQMIFGGISNMITANGAVATQGVAANTIERLIAMFDKAMAKIKKMG